MKENNKLQENTQTKCRNEFGYKPNLPENFVVRRGRRTKMKESWFVFKIF